MKIVFFEIEKIIIFSMRRGFGFNVDLFETNVLNLGVVLRIVVTVVGDAFRSILDQRRQTILCALQEADQKAIEAQKRLEEAQKVVEQARFRVEEIRTQSIQTAMQERSSVEIRQNEDLKRFQEKRQQEIRLERQRIVQVVVQKVADLSLASAQDSLLIAFRTKDQTCSKQKELNEVYVRENFRQFKRLSLNVVFRKV